MDFSGSERQLLIIEMKKEEFASAMTSRLTFMVISFRAITTPRFPTNYK